MKDAEREWGRFLAELDRRIDSPDVDPDRRDRLRAMRPKLRAVNPRIGYRRLSVLMLELGFVDRE